MPLFSPTLTVTLLPLTVAPSIPLVESSLLPLLRTSTSTVFSPPSAGKLKEVGSTERIQGISALKDFTSSKLRGTSCPLFELTAARPEIESRSADLNVLFTKAAAAFLQNTVNAFPSTLNV